MQPQWVLSLKAGSLSGSLLVVAVLLDHGERPQAQYGGA